MLKRPNYIDAGILSIFAVFITWQPYFLYGKINLFELGIYLPGIMEVLHGAVPYRDFFHLRGPLELYIPALLMRCWGENISVLSSYFYVGTVLGLVLCVLIARELLRTRVVLYLLILVLIGRTFPRVVFHIWGGMRFSMGLLAVLFAIYFYKHKRSHWIFLSGLASAAAALISLEIGVCCGAAIVAASLFSWYLNIQDRAAVLKSIGVYFLGILAVALPYVLYLILTSSLLPYLDATFSVATRMTQIFPDYLFEEHPRNFLEAVMALSPFSPHFKHLTPAYCYFFLVGYLAFRLKKRSFRTFDLGLIVLSVYGGIMYILAFRKIGAGQFEMALQPEKILLFIMLEEFFLILLKKKEEIKALRAVPLKDSSSKKNLWKILGIYFLLGGFLMSSVGYAIQRYDHRFIAFQLFKNWVLQKETKHLRPLNNEESEVLSIEKAQNMVAPLSQVRDLEQLTRFIDENTAPGETVFMFPEMGAYHFIVDRPFVGRFPMVTFAWINDRWHDELLADLKAAQPRVVVLPQHLDATFEKAYFKVPGNFEKFDAVMRHIDQNYVLAAKTPSLYIYQKH